jgi:hypothetical protein
MQWIAYLKLALAVLQLAQQAAEERREPTDDELADLARSDAFRAVAEADWKSTLPKD